MAGTYDALARVILENVGGAGNVESIAHCITRLRFKLKDESLGNDEVLEATEGVVKVMHAGGQYQVVIGPHVNEVFDAVVAAGSLNAGGSIDEAPAVSSGTDAPAKKQTFMSVAIDLISGILQPVLPVLAAGGMTKGLLSLAAFLGWISKDSGTYTVICSFADGIFYFLPIFLGLTAARKFKINEFVGAAIGAALCFPAMVNIGATAEALGSVLSGTPFEMSYYATFLGLPVIMPQSGYTSSVIPVVLAVWFASVLYKKLEAATPSAVRFFVVPMATLLVTVPLTYLAIGPVASLVTNGLSLLLQSIYEIPMVGGLLCGAFLGGVYQVMVIFGLHWACVPIVLTNLSVLGFDAVLSGREVCTFAQTAATFAIFLKTRDAKLKQIALPAAITGFFGTTEPCIYGVTLPKKTPFIISCIASAIGGGFVGLMGVKKFTSGFTGILGLPIFVDPSGVEGITNVIWLSVGILITMAISFIGTWLTYRDDERKVVD